MYLLDTDTVIYALKGQADVARNLALHADDPLGVSVITLMELYYGAFRSRQVAGNLAKVRSLEKAVHVWDLQADAAEVFGALKAQLESDGTRLDDFDLGIAACALVHNLTLVSHNSAHFARVRGLRLDDWCAAPSE
jgi:predicted nucleic acid-binding protein